MRIDGIKEETLTPVSNFIKRILSMEQSLLGPYGWFDCIKLLLDSINVMFLIILIVKSDSVI